MSPLVLALFQKRIDGDDALMQLAGQRFKAAGLGTELYAETLSDLDRLFRFSPASKSATVVHMDRGLNLLEQESCSRILDFAAGFKDRVFGLIVHDHPDINSRFVEYVAALQKLELRLKNIRGGPMLFIEYAVGIEPGIFIELFKAIQDLQRISCCIDIGHIGLWQARAAFAGFHPQTDVCAILPDDPELPGLIEDLQKAVRSAPDRVLKVIREIGGLGKPLHFHLHDAHPLSTFSPFGVSDHLSFLAEIPIPFKYKGKGSLAPMFGPAGLSRIIRQVLQLPAPERISLSLEIHPTQARRPLGDVAHLFKHWKDKTNAERMNCWLSILLENHQLILEACRETTAKDDHI